MISEVFSVSVFPLFYVHSYSPSMSLYSPSVPRIYKPYLVSVYGSSEMNELQFF